MTNNDEATQVLGISAPTGKTLLAPRTGVVTAFPRDRLRRGRIGLDFDHHGRGVVAWFFLSGEVAGRLAQNFGNFAGRSMEVRTDRLQCPLNSEEVPLRRY